MIFPHSATRSRAIQFLQGIALAITAALMLSACDWLDPTLWGKEPREVLVKRVVDARDAQQETVEQFQTAMEKFKSVTNFSGGDLEAQFNTLNSAFERSEGAVKDITSRVDRVVAATNDLLSEWQSELDKYHDASLRERAARQLEDTRVQSERLIAAMRKAEAKSKPVLDVFRDQVLFMKHNLNMQAITSLESQTVTIEADVSRMIQEMRNSIAEADRFIKTMESGA